MALIKILKLKGDWHQRPSSDLEEKFTQIVSLLIVAIKIQKPEKFDYLKKYDR